MKRILKFLAILAILLPASSCRKPGQGETYPPVLYYKLFNDSGSRIRVYFIPTRYSYRTGNHVNDSVVYFNPGDNRTLLVLYTDYGAYSMVENADTLKGLKSLNIFRDDTIPLRHNYRLRQYWAYEKVNDHKSEISLRITNEDF